jgi:hypothetical protein
MCVMSGKFTRKIGTPQPGLETQVSELPALYANHYTTVAIGLFFLFCAK